LAQKAGGAIDAGFDTANLKSKLQGYLLDAEEKGGGFICLACPVLNKVYTFRSVFQGGVMESGLDTLVWPQDGFASLDVA
jgi:hypothetical protein